MPQTNPSAWVHLLGARGSHRQRGPGLEGLPWVFGPMTDRSDRPGRSAGAAPADQPELHALGHRLAAGGDPELGVGRRQVAIDRGLTYEELTGDVEVRAASAKPGEDLPLARGEHSGQDRKSTRLNSSH